MKVRFDEADDALYGVDVDTCTCANTAQTMAKALIKLVALLSTVVQGRQAVLRSFCSTKLLMMKR